MASAVEPPPSEPRPSNTEETKPVVAEQLRSTGNRWTDLKLAVQRISFWDDLRHIGEIPCAPQQPPHGHRRRHGHRVRKFECVTPSSPAEPFVAANWAMGTFVVVSLGAWNVCQSAIRREREQVRVVVEQMAARKLRFAAPDGNHPAADGDAQARADATAPDTARR
ncbi:hypothetical protein EW145_g7766 [Phellinidium pouzarii]|uniref:Cytochrome c oxidase assembly protein COX20, mitochondrial n=1 Tax=Phellinidium pouzarii TaxID=167371 RepID=A0A4S4KEE8_9AGAM|nr:hypothetical protein EW145_g7766 [Phellinidium pouzarii]